MLNRLPVLTKALIIGAVVLCGTTVGYAQETALRGQIEAAEDRLEAAMQRGDATAIAALYTEDAQLLVPNAELVTGRAAIAVLPHPAMNIELETREVEGQGDTAYEVGTYTVYGEDRAVLDEGKYLVIWKQEDGAWKLHRDIFNSSRPAAPPGGEDDAALYRARHGEQLGLVLYRVKPAQQTAFERFVGEVLWPAARAVQPEVAARVRFWKGLQAQQDGTVPYAIVFDPYMPAGEYDIERLLVQVHGQEKAISYMKDLMSITEGYTFTPFIQDK